jgi:hypothetical protein
MTNGLQAGTISLETCAKLLKLTPRRVNQLEAAGVIPKAARGRYVTVAVVHAYIAHLHESSEDTPKSKAANRIQNARATEIELRTARELDSLICLDEAVGYLTETVADLREDFGGFGKMLSGDVAFQRKIDLEIADIFRRVSERIAVEAAQLRGAT